MSGTLNRKHWYDGWFYARYLDSWIKEVREMISGFIEDDSSVIDIGSGTGALALQLAGKCRYVVGVEISSQMIEFANRRREKGSFPNVEFLHLDALKLSDIMDQKFDYATMSVILHEMPMDDGLEVINEMKGIAGKLIIADFKVPQPRSLRGILNIAPELLASIDHFRNCISFISHGGIETLLNEVGLKIEREATDSIGKYKVVKASLQMMA